MRRLIDNGNTDLKKRLAAYAGQHPDQCKQTDADPETGCMEFEITKGRFSFRLTAHTAKNAGKPPAKRQKHIQATCYTALKKVWYNFFEKLLRLM